jgi:hypothetical protein
MQAITKLEKEIKIFDINLIKTKGYYQKFYVIFDNTKQSTAFCNQKEFKYSIFPTKIKNYVFFHIWKHISEANNEIILNNFNDQLNKVKKAIKKINAIATIFTIDEKQI